MPKAARNMVPSLPIKLAQIGCGLDFSDSSAGCGDYFIEAGRHVELKHYTGRLSDDLSRFCQAEISKTIRFDCGTQTHLSFLVEHQLLDIGPKFGERVFAHESSESPDGPQGCGATRRLTVGSPGIGKEVIPWRGNVTGIGGHTTAAAVVSHESHDYYASYTVFERVVGVPEITIAWVLSPQGAESRLDDVTGRDAGKTHSVTVSEASPMRSVFFGSIPPGAYACAKKTYRERFRADGVVDNPGEALASGNRLVGR